VRRAIDRDLLGSLLLFLLAGVSFSQLGHERRDWVFPRYLTYLIFVLAVILAIKVVIRFVTKGFSAATFDKSAAIKKTVDVVVFCVLALAYVLLTNGLGFWTASLLMLIISSVYLKVEKTPKSMAIAVGTALVVCVIAYFVFLHLFYVPVPVAQWWHGLVPRE
jgi:hypothetical protein